MMDERTRDLLLRAATGDASEPELAEIDSLLMALPSARSERAEIERLVEVIRGVPAESFSPGFAARVSERIGGRARGSADRFADSLLAVFYRVGFAGLVLAFGLGAWNTARAVDADGNALEIALALPTVSFESAYVMEARSMSDAFVSPVSTSPAGTPTPPDGSGASGERP